MNVDDVGSVSLYYNYSAHFGLFGLFLRGGQKRYWVSQLLNFTVRLQWWMWGRRLIRRPMSLTPSTWIKNGSFAVVYELSVMCFAFICLFVGYWNVSVGFDGFLSSLLGLIRLGYERANEGHLRNSYVGFTYESKQMVVHMPMWWWPI